MKVLFLFNSIRKGAEPDIRTGKRHDNNFWGMFRLRQYGIDAQYAEPEQVYPGFITRFMRRVFTVYTLHMFVFWKFFSYDFIFSSTAFGTQLFVELIPWRRPRWVMHDFSIMGLLGNEQSLRQRLFRFGVMHTAGVVTIAQEEAERVKKRFPHLADHTECIRLGVDTKFFAPQPREEEQRILAVGFDPGRDYKTFLKACEGLPATVSLAARRHMLGSLEPLPEWLEVRSYTPQEMVQEYARAAVVVIPLDISNGVNEAMGCSTLVEAMAMGKAVVVTRTPTMESYIKNGENGVLMSAKDPAELRRVLEELLENKSLRKQYGEKARQFALEECDADKQAQKMANYFKRLYEYTKSPRK